MESAEPSDAAIEQISGLMRTFQRRADLAASAADLTQLLRQASPDAAASQLAAATRRTLGPDAVAVWRLNLEREQWEIVGHEGLSEAYAHSVINVAGNTGGLPNIPIAAEDVERLAMLDERRQGYRDEGIRSLLAVPLEIGGKNRATLTLYWREPHALDGGTVNEAAEMAAIVARAIEAAGLL